MTDVAITAESLTKRFRVPLDHGGTLQYRFAHPVRTSRHRDLLAVDGVSFQVAAGEFIGISGPNGCGKSTLLRLLAGIYEPDGGRVTVHGTVSPFLELGVGFKADFTARENVFLGGAVLGLTRRQIAERVGDVLEFAGIEPFADQKLRNFSSGMSVRLAFSVAMLADADILLMDEVLAVGDARFQEKCFEVFEWYKRHGRTIVLVSHDLRSLETYCDRMLLMQLGRVVSDGPPSDVIADYRQWVGSAVAAPVEDSGSAGLHPARRWGSREIEVVGVRLLNSAGKEQRTFTAGGTLEVQVDYLAHRDIEHFECALAFRRGTGQPIATPVTKMSHFRLGSTSAGQQGTITYRLDDLRILAGSVALTAALYDPHLVHAYDHLEDVLELHIVDERARLGMVELGGTWSECVHSEPRQGAAAPAADSPHVART